MLFGRRADDAVRDLVVLAEQQAHPAIGYADPVRGHAELERRVG